MKHTYTKFLAALSIACLPFLAQAQCTTATNISTFAGSHVNGYSGDGGMATAAQIGGAYGVATDNSGNVYIADFSNNAVRMINSSGIITTIAGTGVAGYNGDGIAATTAQLNGPMGVTVDPAGNIYIADKYNERIRMIDGSGTITTIAGNGYHGGWQGHDFGYEGLATAASLDFPVSVALDCSGNIYIADLGSHTIRRIDRLGYIHNFAGTHAGGFNGDNMQATDAQLNSPTCVLADCSGNVYIADSWNNRIRKVYASGIITTIAGNGTGAYSGDGGDATAASLWIPNGITIDGCGTMYICDWQNNAVRTVDLAGNIHTFAGNNVRGYNGDGAAATAASLYLPSSLAVDKWTNNVYIADYGNNVIREMGTNTYASRAFVGGTTQSLNVCASATGTSINELMAIPDATGGKTETWTITEQPLHGTLGGFNATALSKGGVVTPAGLTFTPAAGFTGTDEFTVIMNDGTTSASTTINVNVTPMPNPGTITGAAGVRDGNKISLIAANADQNGVWSSSNPEIAIIDAAGNVTGMANGMTTIAYTVTNACGSKAASTTIVAEAEAVAAKAFMFPNPNNGTFQCEFTSATDQELELVATDVTGRIVYKQAVTATAGANVARITLPADLPRPSSLIISLGNSNTKFPATKITITE